MFLSVCESFKHYSVQIGDPRNKSYEPFRVQPLKKLNLFQLDKKVSIDLQISSRRKFTSYDGNTESLSIIFSFHFEATSAAAASSQEKGQQKPLVTLILYIGGCTFSEISAFR
jgi:hypothetical protein